MTFIKNAIAKMCENKVKLQQEKQAEKKGKDLLIALDKTIKDEEVKAQQVAEAVRSEREAKVKYAARENQFKQFCVNYKNKQLKEKVKALEELSKKEEILENDKDIDLFQRNYIKCKYYEERILLSTPIEKLSELRLRELYLLKYAAKKAVVAVDVK
jgi:hypothetical protein